MLNTPKALNLLIKFVLVLAAVLASEVSLSNEQGETRGFCSSLLSQGSSDAIEALLTFGFREGHLDRDGLAFLSNAKSGEGFPFKAQVRSMGFEETLRGLFSSQEVDWEAVQAIASKLLQVLSDEAGVRDRDRATSEAFLSFRLLEKRRLPTDLEESRYVYLKGRPFAFYVSSQSAHQIRIESIDLISGKTGRFVVNFRPPDYDRYSFRGSVVYPIYLRGRVHLAMRMRVRVYDRESSTGNGGGDSFLVVPLEFNSFVESYENFSIPFGARAWTHRSPKNGDLLVFLGPRENESLGPAVVFDPQSFHFEMPSYSREGGADVVLSLDEDRFVGINVRGRSLLYWEDPEPAIRRTRRGKFGAFIDMPLPEEFDFLILDSKSIGVVGKGEGQRVVLLGQANSRTKTIDILYVFDPFTREIRTVRLDRSVKVLGPAGSFSDGEHSYIGWVVADHHTSSINLLTLNMANDAAEYKVLKSLDPWDRWSSRNLQGKRISSYGIETPLFFKVLGKVYAICPTRPTLLMRKENGAVDDPLDALIDLNVVDLEAGETVNRLTYPKLTWRGRMSRSVMNLFEAEGRPFLVLGPVSGREAKGMVDHLVVEVLSRGPLE